MKTGPKHWVNRSVNLVARLVGAFGKQAYYAPADQVMGLASSVVGYCTESFGGSPRLVAGTGASIH